MAETKRALATLLTNISDGGSNTAEEVRDAILTLADSGLFTDATKTASFTAVKGSIYPISIAAATANIDVTFPATPAAGDTFGFYMAIQNTTAGASGFATAPFWGVEPLATTDINNVSYSQAAGDGVGKWGLMLDGEVLVFRYDAVASTWVVVQDGRIMHACCCRPAADTTGETANIWTNCGFDTADENIGGIYDTTGEVGQIKRAGKYTVNMTLLSAAVIGNGSNYIAAIYDGSNRHGTHSIVPGGSSSARFSASADFPFAAAATITPQFRSSEGSRGVDAVSGQVEYSSFALRENR